jgi:hypothetical protein
MRTLASAAPARQDRPMPSTPAMAAFRARLPGGAAASNRSRNRNLNCNARPPQAGD